MPGLKELRVAQPCPPIEAAHDVQQVLNDATILGHCSVHTAKKVNDLLDELVETAYTKGVREGRRLECADQLSAYARRFGFQDEKVDFYHEDPITFPGVCC